MKGERGDVSYFKLKENYFTNDAKTLLKSIRIIYEGIMCHITSQIIK